MAQGFSVQVWGTWSRWFKSSLPETQEGQLNGWPSLCFRASRLDLKPGGRRTTECCPKPGRPGGGLQGAVGQIQSARNEWELAYAGSHFVFLAVGLDLKRSVRQRRAYKALSMVEVNA